MSDEAERTDDYDTPWKRVIQALTESFMVLLFPAVHRAIDWDEPPVFLDNEVARLHREAKAKSGAVDNVFRVRLLSGQRVRVLIHVEVQAQRDREFAERMFRYHYRLFERHEDPTVSLAVLADESRSWRPCRFERALLGCELRFAYPIVKLLDLEDRYDELEVSDNPFAYAVMAHIKTQQTRHQAKNRALFKRALCRSLLQRRFPRRAIISVFDFIDWIMALPEDLQRLHVEQTSQFMQEKGMPYMNFWEQQGHDKGRQEGLEKGLEKGRLQQARRAVLRALEARFGAVPEAMAARINAIAELDRLDALHAQAVTVASLGGFETQLPAAT